jgi:hypothetical protein
MNSDRSAQLSVIRPVALLVLRARSGPDAFDRGEISHPVKTPKFWLSVHGNISHF